MTWKPSNQPTGYDRGRVAQVKPMRVAIEQLGLPLARLRRLNGILNALTMQIEDGGDSPEVNSLLLDALRAAIRHQVGEDQGTATLQAIDAFGQAEAERWELVRGGHTPPRLLTQASVSTRWSTRAMTCCTRSRRQPPATAGWRPGGS